MSYICGGTSATSAETGQGASDLRMIYGSLRVGTGGHGSRVVPDLYPTAGGMTLAEAVELERVTQDRGWLYTGVFRDELRRAIETGVPPTAWDCEGVTAFSRRMARTAGAR